MDDAAYLALFEEIEHIRALWHNEYMPGSFLDLESAAIIAVTARLDMLAEGISMFGKGGIGGLLGGLFSPKAVDFG